MTESFGLFDAADPEAPDRVYTSEAFARLFKTMMRDGIVHNDGAELAVGPTVPAAMSVSVGTGMALIQGRYYINDGDLTLNVEAADPSHPRIDRVVVRLEATPGRTIHAVVKKGTPAPSPVPPGLTRTAETWELSLAQVRVEAGATSIVAGKITDERGNASLCGVAAPVYVPSSQVEVVGAVDMRGKALTGLPAPSGATDAARKGYVDSEIAGKIGGFGISQVAIDADMDWGGNTISNVHIGAGSSCLLVQAFPSPTLQVSSDARKRVYSNEMAKITEITLSPNLSSGSAFLVEYVCGQSSTAFPYTGDYQVYVNGVPRGELHAGLNKSLWDGGTKISEVIRGLRGGDKIQIYGCTNHPDVSNAPVAVENFRLFGDYTACPEIVKPTHTVTL